MTNNSSESKEFNIVNLILFVWKWKWPMIIVPFLAILGAVIFSGPHFITPMFRSNVVMFPTSTNSISKALLAENSGMKQDLMEFGEEEEAEQLLQILGSSVIREKIIQKYDLMNHYDIDTNSNFIRTKLYKEYSSNIESSRTEYMGVEISVMDKDPDIAAGMANDIADLLDSTKNKMQKERALKGFNIVKAEYERLLKDIALKEDSMAKLRLVGIHDYESQAEMINRQLAIEIARNANSSGVRALEKKLETLAKYGTQYVSIRDQLEHEKKQLSMIKSKYEEAKVDAEEYVPQTFIVDRAYAAEKKVYPVRWIIVAIAAISSFLLTFFALIIFQGIKDAFLVNKSEI